MREQGELDVTVYPKIKENATMLKKNEIEPKQFPAKQEDIKYPEHALKLGNPLYQTSSMTYGAILPSQTDMPTKFFPRTPNFTNEFTGGNFVNNGLITQQKPHRVRAGEF